jgi:Radical SAM superfamily
VTAPILEKALDGERISDEEALTLLESKDLVQIGQAADELRARHTDSGRITFIIDRNVNYTNVCVTDCDFCAFYRRPGDRAEGYLLPKSVIYKKVEETLSIGGTGVLMQGGHHPDLGIDYYEDLFRSLKERYPIHLHALSPPEIQHIARRSKLTVPATLTRLRDAGLDSIPGGGAEILVDRVRDVIAPKKTRTADWLGVMRHAHRLGMSTTATMMYGHVETLAERVEHMRRIRELPAGRHAPRPARHALPDLVRIPAHAGREPHLPRQRRPHPVLVGHAGDESGPGRARVRRRRPRLGDDRGERRLRRRNNASRLDGRLHPRDQGPRQDPGAARHAVPRRQGLELAPAAERSRQGFR